MARRASDAKLVLMAVDFGEQLLEMGAYRQAEANFATAVALNEPFVNELLSEDAAVAERAAARRLPRNTDLLTYTTSPLLHLAHSVRQRGNVAVAFQIAEQAAGLFALLAPYSVKSADFLDELGELARQAGQSEFGRQCSEQARQIREYNAQGGV
jgi:hypothetical protein